MFVVSVILPSVSLERDVMEDKGKPNRPLHETYAGRALTVKEVADILHIDAATVRRYIKDGHLEALNMPMKSGGKRRTLRIRGRSVDKIIGNAEDTGAN